jgi:hypothetical protein
MAVFAAADTPLRARAVREAMHVEITPSDRNNVCLKLKRTSLLCLTERPNRASPQAPPAGGARSRR